MYEIRKVDKDGTEHEPFILSLEGLNMLLNMATPFKCYFKIMKIQDS